jgi:hypothetical protein
MLVLEATGAKADQYFTNYAQPAHHRPPEYVHDNKTIFFQMWSSSRRYSGLAVDG